MANGPIAWTAEWKCADVQRCGRSSFQGSKARGSPKTRAQHQDYTRRETGHRRRDGGKGRDSRLSLKLRGPSSGDLEFLDVMIISRLGERTEREESNIEY